MNNKNFRVFLIVLIIKVSILTSCDMFVLLGINDNDLMTIDVSPGRLDDPLDYFAFLQSNSGDIPLNNDGYGIVAYNVGSQTILPHYRWYKTGYQTWYDNSNPDEPLNNALMTLMPDDSVSIIMGHARNGTGGNGNHPLLFEHDGVTYSFMHNGFYSSQVKQDIIEFLGSVWFHQHPSQWEGEYYDVNSFIDSELLFHYLMYYIIQTPDNIPLALKKAFNNKNVGNSDLEYLLKYNDSAKVNFVLSNGEDSYVYRSTKLIGTSYNLSYETFNNQFIAIKTGTSLHNTVAKNQLLQFTQSGFVNNLSINQIAEITINNFSANFISLNKVNLSWNIEHNDMIESFHIFRSTNKDFQNSMQIGDSLLIEDYPNQDYFSLVDNNAPSQSYYYWIRTKFVDGHSYISPFVEARNNYIPDSPEEQLLEVSDIYPNPFETKAKILAFLPTNASVKIFNIKGQLVRNLSNSSKEQDIFWDGKDNKGKEVSTGIYIIKFSSNKQTIYKKVLKVK